jgi:ubiquitin-conjugating enzyme (huntingtin interacting protein 2)
MKEYQDLQKNQKENTVTVWMIDNDIHHWKGKIHGPIDTCYSGGVFIIDIVIPNDYPFKPPKMKFDTKIWHPNISSVTGAICLDILKNEWTPALTIRTALISLQALMCEPVPDDPQDAVVAKEYLTDIKKFNEKAKQWVEEYANPEKNFKKKIKELMDMGFTEDKCKEALEKANNDLEKAINLLLGGA